MDTVLRLIILASTLLLVGCQGWSDFMKYPPGPERLWSKKGASIEEMRADRKACHDYARQQGIELARDRRIFSEACMLEQGYIFTNYRSRDFADYCSKDNFGGGLADAGLTQRNSSIHLNGRPPFNNYRHNERSRCAAPAQADASPLAPHLAPTGPPIIHSRASIQTIQSDWS